MQLSQEYQNQIKTWGLSISQIENQIQNFINGFPFLPIVRPATPDDGVLVPSAEKVNQYIGFYEGKRNRLEIVKFVPASGAASRMFKDLFEFLDKGAEAPSKAVEQFLIHLKDFAFYNSLKAELGKHGKSMEDATDVISGLLYTLGYGNLPKGALEFHQYEKGTRTAIDEHFAEGALYAAGKNNMVNIHFTVSPEFAELFEKLSSTAKEKFEHTFGVKFTVAFSQQKKSTDTIAVTLENQPFIDDDGTILFRPAGHGALIENLNEIDGDIIFIKNIDNVVPDRIKAETITYKKVLAGILLSYQEKIFRYISELKNNNTSIIDEVIAFLQEDLNTTLPSSFATVNQVEYLIQKLNRPIRVCGMVKNTGEPGGGPFWVENTDGSISLQIAESVQIDPNDKAAQLAVKKATHFNPVDIVCGVRNYNGEKFDLRLFTDPSTGFITSKSKSGRALKAQELPGLWNGAMADWITLFVDVPLITFNPVKTVNDLLRPEHQ